MSQPRMVIGICGGSGSGKTTFAREIQKEVGADRVSMLELDAYYRNCSELPRLEDGTENWDHPDALDLELFRQHLVLLQSGQAIECPVYNFATHSRECETTSVQPRGVVIAEGVMLLATQDLQQLLDLIVFIDVPADTRLARRMRRDITQRGRTPESVLDQYQETVQPMHDQYVEPGRHSAHLIVPLQTANQSAVNVVAAAVRAAMNDEDQSGS